MTQIVFQSDRDVEVTDQQIDCGPISRVGRVLRQAGIPNILWGCWAAAYNGRKRLGGAIEFVVEDDTLTEAVNALIEAGYRCGGIKDDYSTLLSPDQRWNSWFTFPSNEEIWGPVVLHKKSNVLWWLLCPLPAEDPSHGLITDGRIFEQAHYLPQELTPKEDEAMLLPDDFAVAILTPVVYAEALIRLYCRDLNHSQEVCAHWANHMFEIIMRRPSPRGYILDNLEDQFRPFWDAFCSGAPCVDEARELRTLLYDCEELPYVAWNPNADI